MRKTLYILIVALAAAVSCEEWDPVLTLEYPEPDAWEQVTMQTNTTIAELKAMYNKKPVDITRDIIIGGQVISSDLSGNIYRSFYIQDETGGIEIKIGKSSTNCDYVLGQWVYVKCSGLTLGSYNGMLQLGYKCQDGSYETAYIDSQYIIDTHIFRGKKDTPVAAKVITGSDMTKSVYQGMFVKIEDLTYANEIFGIIYDNAVNSNRIFLSDGTCGVDTWAMSKAGFKSYMTASKNGEEVPQTAFDGKVTAADWQAYYDAASAVTLSQYFNVPGTKTQLQIRTSGYSKFADTKIDERILNGAKFDASGILTVYGSNIQFTLIDLDGVEIQ